MQIIVTLIFMWLGQNCRIVLIISIAFFSGIPELAYDDDDLFKLEMTWFWSISLLLLRV